MEIGKKEQINHQSVPVCNSWLCFTQNKGSCYIGKIEYNFDF